VQAVLSPATGTIEINPLHEAIGDFPRIDTRKLGYANRYTVLTAASGHTELVPGEHDTLCRVDLQTGAWEQFEPDGVIGETLFAPRPGGTDELDGYYLGLVTSFTGGHTALGVWDAADFPGPPRARVHLPQRVPNGLHGSWFPTAP
jgi:carotenoid cleavage dioxygenase-like enzyme